MTCRELSVVHYLLAVTLRRNYTQSESESLGGAGKLSPDVRVIIRIVCLMIYDFVKYKVSRFRP